MTQQTLLAYVAGCVWISALLPEVLDETRVQVRALLGDAHIGAPSVWTGWSPIVQVPITPSSQRLMRMAQLPPHEWQVQLALAERMAQLETTMDSRWGEERVEG